MKYGRYFSTASPTLESPFVAKSASVPESCCNCGMLSFSRRNRFRIPSSHCVCNGTKLFPIFTLNMSMALFRICLTASGVAVLMSNSRCILFMYASWSATISRAFRYTSRFFTIFAPPSAAHTPKSCPTAFSLRSCGRFAIPSNSVFSVPMLSSVMDFETHSAVSPISWRTPFCFLVISAPLDRFRAILLMLVPTRSEATPVASIASASAAVVEGSIPASDPREAD